MKLEFSLHIFEKYLNTNFHENPSIGGPVVSCGQTDMTKLIFAFRNFSKIPDIGLNKPLTERFKNQNDYTEKNALSEYCVIILMQLQTFQSVLD
jgi:hypothetical protein